MKKFLVCLLIFSICSCIIGCSNKAAEKVPSKKEEVSSETKKEDTSSVDSSVSEPTVESEISGTVEDFSSDDSTVSEPEIEEDYIHTDDNSIKINLISNGKLSNIPEAGPYYSKNLATELFPITRKIKNKLISFISTAHSGAVEHNLGKTVLDSSYLNFDTMVMPTYPNYQDAEGKQLPVDAVGDLPYWRRNYFGVFDIYANDHFVYSINHCENKNEMVENNWYNNTVLESEYGFTTEDYGGMFDGKYRDSNYYFAFITLSVCRSSEVMKNGSLSEYDYGPVVWPEYGYVSILDTPNGTGLRHPSMFVEGNNIYIFYVENGNVKAARAKMDNTGRPGPFYKFYNGDFISKGLPDGFNAADKSFLRVGSDPGTNIISDRTHRFFVRKVKNSDYYVGVYTAQNSDGFSICLRASKDLVHWSAPTKIASLDSLTWEDSSLYYARLYNADMIDSEEIDLNNFYIAGTHDGICQYIKVSAKIVKQ